MECSILEGNAVPKEYIPLHIGNSGFLFVPNTPMLSVALES